ncbi:MAG TPA: hemolysin family protein [Candidatus Koribacter sp.]|jgi:CBS domain containing-hemolysin-like protein
MVTYTLLRLIAVAFLVALNAFFVSAEFALVSVRETRLLQLIDANRTGARTVQRLHNRLDEVLAAVQLGVTVASLALGWIGELALAVLFQPHFAKLPHGAYFAHGLAAAISFTIITFFHVTLGEVVPKTIALQRAEQVALAVAAPMEVFITVASPILAVMRSAARFVLRLFGTRELREGGVHSPEELKLMVTASRKFGLVPALQEEMINRAIDLENISVREIMVPRPDIFSLPGDLTLDEAVQRVVDEQHSRIPVYDVAQGPEHIIGVLYAKDLMRWMRYRLARLSANRPAKIASNLKVQHIMREVLVVPETKPLTDLLEEFKQRKRHLAVVVDEFGSTAGVVTVEDVLEELVGEIEDEYDVPEQSPLTVGGATMVLDGGINIRDLESQYQIRLPRDEGFETLGGFVMARLQRLPHEGDSVEYNNHRYTVIEMEGRRIDTIKVDLLAQHETKEQTV